MKQTAIEWLQKQLECFGNKHELQMSWATVDELLDQAKEMEKEQRGYSEEDVIKIVEKSRETGLTAEYLLLTFKQQEL
jgi:hypothetical protein